MAEYFHFKQYSLRHDRSAQKVGTDSCLLGAMVAAHTPSPTLVLDMGSGCGILATMIAQRYPKAHYTLVDIHEGSTLDALDNMRALTESVSHEVVCTDVLQWNPEIVYDLVVCNPPYFRNALLSPIKDKNMARHQATLTLECLMHQTSQLLSEHGVVWILHPYSSKSEVMHFATSCSLRLLHCIDVSATPSKAPHIAIFIFNKFNSSTFDWVEPLPQHLTIQDTEARYDPFFYRLLQDYYTIF